MPGCSGGLVVTNARVYYTTRAAAGASAPGIPHALRGARSMHDSGALRRGIADVYPAVIARSTCDEESSFLFFGAKAGSLPPSLFELRRTSRGACHRARVRATRWLAMTILYSLRLGCLKFESEICVGRARSISRFDACHRQASFPASGMARKVIVAGANVTASAVVGMPSIVGSSLLAGSSSGRPLSRMRSSSKFAASSV
jgi:hypothetical protein